MKIPSPLLLNRTRAGTRAARFPSLVGACLALVALALGGCGRSGSSGSAQDADGRPLTIGVAFETLQTEYWIAGYEAIKAECARRGFRVIEAVADNDANRQLQQVRNFITRKVDGIILVPKDASTCIPMIRAANAANIPIVLFNRPAGRSDAKSVAVVADNFALTRETVAYLIEEARKSGRKHKAMVLLGDLGDMNAIGRRDGFEAAVTEAPGIVDVVARIPTEWNQEKAHAGVVNALQAHPDISFIFTSSDFLLPSIVSALRSAGKYHKIGTPGHVLLGGFDGDATAYAMLLDGYLDATGVQDVYFEAEQSVQAIVDLRAGRELPEIIQDPGFVIHQGNLKEKAPQMWGANLQRK
ncbi:MAG: sugar ABC transporter substrate-binding protein [Verrucomicrobiae bacterium]|nr:sugar ABC transporter substrate-binding protein [Verrucomicrobiae bacterium]